MRRSPSPLISFETSYGSLVYKEVLKRRGIIAHASTRWPEQQELDDHDHQALDRLLAELEPFFTVK